MKKDVLKVKEIPVPRSSCHELPKHDVLPSHEFTLGLIAPKVSLLLT
jgi:hypothetical protein